MKKLIAFIAALCVVLSATSFASAKGSTVIAVSGKFYVSYEATVVKDPELEEGSVHTFYQFRSNDGTVWWDLTEEQIGHKPATLKDIVDKDILQAGKSINSLIDIEWEEYVLVFDNMGTTDDNKPCDCLPEYECECERYDDELITIVRSDKP